MKIYISGIGGTGMGPLALMAREAGHEVVGSDLQKGAILNELEKAGIEVKIGPQDGAFLKEKIKEGVDWFVYTSALPKDHSELKIAQEAGIKTTKRDDLTAFLVDELGLKMVAVAGTHGKTTTTAMIIWTALAMKLPVSYIVGTTLGFAPSGAYHKGDKYFIYEADEYDRNFLKFKPWLALITNVGYDHSDIYKKPRDYRAAFLQFQAQSEKSINTETDFEIETKGEGKQYYPHIAGVARRTDARLAMAGILSIGRDMFEMGNEFMKTDQSDFDKLRKILDGFPGVGRRFERIAEGIYTDYAHHPEEIKATIQVAQEEAEILGKKGVVAIYEPHQNSRQYEIAEGYDKAFLGVEKVFWLPTFLTRENKSLEVLKPEDLIKKMENQEVAEVAKTGEDLARKIKEYVAKGYLVVLMTAGPADEWLRKEFVKN